MSGLRQAYVRWLGHAAPLLLSPLFLIAGLQAASSASWWTDPTPDVGGLRYLFMSAAVASAVFAGTIRKRETSGQRLDTPALVSLSWRLASLSIAPAVIGAVLALMSRRLWDFYAMWAVTLGALVVLFPRYDQWMAWSGAEAGGEG